MNLTTTLSNYTRTQQQTEEIKLGLNEICDLQSGLKVLLERRKIGTTPTPSRSQTPTPTPDVEFDSVQRVDAFKDYEIFKPYDKNIFNMRTSKLEDI